MTCKLKTRIKEIFDEWMHGDGASTLYDCARDLLEHGYTEDEAFELIELVVGVIKTEYGE